MELAPHVSEKFLPRNFVRLVSLHVHPLLFQELRDLSLRVNYTDRATVACR
jgi:hypothetical protein